MHTKRDREITKINIARSPLFTIDKDHLDLNEDSANVNLKSFMKNCEMTEKTREIGLVLVPAESWQCITQRYFNEVSSRNLA